jgi:RHS repeat-associated protein
MGSENQNNESGGLTPFITNNYALGAGNRLASWGANGSTLYDAAGNTTNLVANDGTSLGLQWDERYRLTSVSSATSAVEYSHDVLGRRTSRISHSTLATNEVHFVYAGNQVVADLDASGNPLRTYTWGPGIDNLLSLTAWTGGPGATPAATYYPLKDHQNSVIALADASGTVVESYEYDAWGNPTVCDASGSEISNGQSQVGNRYLWQGREYDYETRLYYFRARWYNPETGRWLSKDPIGISGGLNMYVFCGNNPVNFVDPFGRQEEETFGYMDGINPLAQEDVEFGYMGGVLPQSNGDTNINIVSDPFNFPDPTDTTVNTNNLSPSHNWEEDPWVPSPSLVMPGSWVIKFIKVVFSIKRCGG